MHASYYLSAGKSLARPGKKQARKHARDARDFNNIEKRAVIKFVFLQGKAPKEIHAILTETLACFLPGRAKDLSAPLYTVICGLSGRTILSHIISQTAQEIMRETLVNFKCVIDSLYNCRIKNQLDASYYFIVLLIGSTCFGHYYAYHQKLATIMLITTFVVSFLVCCRLQVRCG